MFRGRKLQFVKMLSYGLTQLLDLSKTVSKMIRVQGSKLLDCDGRNTRKDKKMWQDLNERQSITMKVVTMATTSKEVMTTISIVTITMRMTCNQLKIQFSLQKLIPQLIYSPNNKQILWLYWCLWCELVVFA